MNDDILSKVAEERRKWWLRDRFSWSSIDPLLSVEDTNAWAIVIAGPDLGYATAVRRESVEPTWTFRRPNQLKVGLTTYEATYHFLASIDTNLGCTYFLFGPKLRDNLDRLIFIGALKKEIDKGSQWVQALIGDARITRVHTDLPKK